jgi:hypothetical protein
VAGVLAGVGPGGARLASSSFSFGKRISARWRHAMWMLVLVRLALPVVPSSPMSVFNLAPKPVTVSTAIVHADGTPAPGAMDAAHQNSSDHDRVGDR